MQKINFTDTTITQKPYVTINNVNYEVHDGIYTGGTDLNAQTFNDMQANIEIAINSIYPVGSIIIRDDTEDMSNFLGFTWEKVFAGRVLVGLDTSQTEFDTIGKIGGEKTHKLTTNEMPSHRHQVYGLPGAGNDTYALTDVGGKMGSFEPQNDLYLGMAQATGGDQHHNNLQPYQVVAYWKRTA